MAPHLALAAVDGVGMAKGPERSWFAVLWAALIGWVPDRDVREARTFLGHIWLALIMLAGLWVMEHAFVWFAPKPLFGWVRIEWFFHAADVGVLFRFAYRAIIEPWQKRRRDYSDDGQNRH